MTLKERFDTKVFPEPNTGCWLWGAAVNVKGYGIIKIDGRVHLAHRVAYALYKKSPIPQELCGCHSCDNPTCVNPDHIFMGSMKDNTRDMVVKGRSYNRCNSNNPRAKLTDQQARGIKQAYKNGVKRRVIHKTFNVSLSAIDDIIYNRSWKTI